MENNDFKGITPDVGFFQEVIDLMEKHRQEESADLRTLSDEALRVFMAAFRAGDYGRCKHNLPRLTEADIDKLRRLVSKGQRSEFEYETTGLFTTLSRTRSLFDTFVSKLSGQLPKLAALLKKRVTFGPDCIEFTSECFTLDVEHSQADAVDQGLSAALEYLPRDLYEMISRNVSKQLLLGNKTRFRYNGGPFIVRLRQKGVR